MIITKAHLEKQLTWCANEREQLAGKLNQVLGIEQHCRHLLAQLDAPEPTGAPEPTSADLAAVQPVVNGD